MRKSNPPARMVQLDHTQAVWLAHWGVGFEDEEVQALRAWEVFPNSNSWHYSPSATPPTGGPKVVLEVDLVGTDWEPTYEWSRQEIADLWKDWLAHLYRLKHGEDPPEPKYEAPGAEYGGTNAFWAVQQDMVRPVQQDVFNPAKNAVAAYNKYAAAAYNFWAANPAYNSMNLSTITGLT
jgi:hypothetical protein